jgi:hypothetical protein
MKTKKIKLGYTISIMAALSVILVAVAMYFTKPSTILAFDINPSIELKVNRLNQVVQINPVNNDAKAIMAGYELTDKNLEDVIQDIVNRLIFNGYIAPGKENEILITTGENSSDKITGIVINKLEVLLQEKHINADLVQQKIEMNDKNLEKAHANDISIGKMAFIEKILDKDSNLSVEELSQLSIAELVKVSKNTGDSENSVENIKTIQISQNDAENESTADADSETEIEDSNQDIEKNQKVVSDAVSGATVLASKTGNNDKQKVINNQKVASNIESDAVSGATVVPSKTKNTVEKKSVTDKKAVTDAVSSASVVSKSGNKNELNYENEKDSKQSKKYNEDQDKEDQEYEDKDNEDSKQDAQYQEDDQEDQEDNEYQDNEEQDDEDQVTNDNQYVNQNEDYDD